MKRGETGGVILRGGGLGANGGGVEQQVGAHEGHAARRLGEPLVPADPHPNARKPRLPHPEPRVACTCEPRGA